MEVRPGVAAIVFDKVGRVLLHWRKIGDAWAPPSGSVEAGERVQSALRREMREETNLEIVVNELVGAYSAPETQIITYPDGAKIHFVTCVFFAMLVRVNWRDLRRASVGNGFRQGTCLSQGYPTPIDG